MAQTDGKPQFIRLWGSGTQLTELFDHQRVDFITQTRCHIRLTLSPVQQPMDNKTRTHNVYFDIKSKKLLCGFVSKPHPAS
jgi:hypothetical protein